MADGRDKQGKFQKGYRGGPGNPFARRVSELRALLYEAVTDEDLRAVVAAIVAAAKTGDQAAARLLLERLLGRIPDQAADNGAVFEAVGDLATIGDVLELQRQALAALAAGQLTIDQAGALVGIADRVRASIADADFEARLAHLEATR